MNHPATDSESCAASVSAVAAPPWQLRRSLHRSCLCCSWWTALWPNECRAEALCALTEEDAASPCPTCIRVGHVRGLFRAWCHSVFRVWQSAECSALILFQIPVSEPASLRNKAHVLLIKVNGTRVHLACRMSPQTLPSASFALTAASAQWLFPVRVLIFTRKA